MRQLESLETTVPAPVCRMEAHFTSSIAVEIGAYFTAKVPPNPQQVSASSISTNSSPCTFARSARGSLLIPNSRSPWHPSWKVTLP